MKGDFIEAVEAALDAATRRGCGCACTHVQPGCKQLVADDILAFLEKIKDFYGARSLEFTNTPNSAQKESVRDRLFLFTLLAGRVRTSRNACGIELTDDAVLRILGGRFKKAED